MDSISKKFLIMDNLAKAMEPLDTRVQGMALVSNKNGRVKKLIK